MGYSTDIDGKLKIATPMTIEHVKLINAICGETPKPEWENPQKADSYIQWEPEQ